MNKTQQLEKQAQDVLREIGAVERGYSVDIFYGDCSCEYTEQRNTSNIGWHLEMEGSHDKGGSHYLGKNFKTAQSRLPSAIKGIIAEWKS